MNPDLEKLQPYPFEKLNALKSGCTPPAQLSHIPLYIGEPKHPTPAFIGKAIQEHLSGLSNYPVTRGLPELRSTITEWLNRRFTLGSDLLDPEKHVIPVNGTREALFAFAQSVINRSTDPVILMPNPFYQIYEGAALLAGAEPYFLNTLENTGFLPDFDAVPEAIWKRVQLVYACSPGNPTGATMSVEQLQHLIELSDRHGFIIASDECYSEIYMDEASPPAGLLSAAYAMGRTNLKNCVVFHSLSKRSNAPGLRSGFVAGDEKIMKKFLLYRTYHGCAMPPPTQYASILAWQDEKHVEENRRLYREKFSAVVDILSPVLEIPDPVASFYLWPRTPVPDTEFARGLFEQQNVTVLPGSFLSREANGINPGRDRIRLALVAETGECIEAARRIRKYVENL